MLGERSDQRGLWEADRLYLDHVGRESFYGLFVVVQRKCPPKCSGKMSVGMVLSY